MAKPRENYFLEKKGEFPGTVKNKMPIGRNQEFEVDWLPIG